ncbi:MAG: dihydropteroate synthase [Alteromonadaceae bacterium]|nr:MAG: dihydropteroate synthase [Alteromonadaceae bacterium]
MGVLNVTPDSFYDGGALYSSGRLNLDLAIDRAAVMVGEGADFIDVGGESTRPGADPVDSQEEVDRVLPVVVAISKRLDVVISIDTSTAQVMTEAVASGAALINDVRALQRPGALQAAVAAGVPVCLMHMQGAPIDMQCAPLYDEDVVVEVSAFLQQRIDACVAAGIPAGRLLVDPGFGFGKTDHHNIRLLKKLEELTLWGMPLLVGLSRKSMIGRLLERDTYDRLPASLALALAAVSRGANILRVHDVAATVDVIKINQLLSESEG